MYDLRPMSEPALAPADVLRRLPAGAQVAFALFEEPLDEVLFALHSSRFTGTLRLGEGSRVDRVCFREGAVVGMAPVPEVDAPDLLRILEEMKLIRPDALSPKARAAKDGFELGRVLLRNGTLSSEALRRAAEEHARRRLLMLYDRPNVLVRVQEGLQSLSRFLPIYVDIRPAIAFGTVVRADAIRKEWIQQKAAGRHVSLVAPYEERRNSYGLPSPLFASLRALAEGLSFTREVRLPGLSRSDSLGLLLLFERMSLLRFRPAEPRAP